MKLIDGLHYFKKDQASWQLTEDTEREAQHVLTLLSRYGNQPDSNALAMAKDTLIKIEQWKAMCIKDRTGRASENSERRVWDALQGAIKAQDDIEAIHSIMQLKGFGAFLDEETGQRRAKVATAVLRFLKPNDWGVVDWRTIAILSQIEKYGSIDQACQQAKNLDPSDLRELFDIIDEKQACEVNQNYRTMRTIPPLSRAADIDMALFGLSLLVWPI